jgi:hypothetical protein
MIDDLWEQHRTQTCDSIAPDQSVVRASFRNIERIMPPVKIELELIMLMMDAKTAAGALFFLIVTEAALSAHPLESLRVLNTV